ncbi:hypothetical protein GF323_05935 [Candidatus Woesearchaeota archaeon]|nr:hypothetical protein [Candidatus Woesearchaeota archaeon]
MIESFSGIRGIYGKELTNDIALRYAYAFRKLCRPAKAVIGSDTRASGEKLRTALIDGLGCDIIDTGVLPAAAVQNAVREYKADGGIIITASHNEPEYNGFKFLDKDGAVLRPKDMENLINFSRKIGALSSEELLSQLGESKPVKRIEKKGKDALKRYRKFIESFFSRKEKSLLKSLKADFIVDPNGGAGITAKDILEGLGIKARYINMKKGEFRREIEPGKSLKFPAAKKKAQFVAGFDCDADRLEIMLNDSKLASGNHILALITEDVLAGIKNPEKETVIVNDATSYVVRETAGKYSAGWKEVEVGEINVVDAMMDFNSPVGGEGSNGGVILPPSRCRDGILTLICLLKIMAKKQQSLKELINSLPKYHYIKEKTALKKDFAEIREKVKQYYLDSGFLIEETGDETGGLKAIKDNSWVWFRQSKTEKNVLRIIADSKKEKTAASLLSQGKKLVS